MEVKMIDEVNDDDFGEPESEAIFSGDAAVTNVQTKPYECVPTQTTLKHAVSAVLAGF